MPKRANAGRKKGIPNRSNREVRELIDENVLLPEMWKAIGRKAQKGDPICARLVCEYRYGKPRQAIELSGGLDVNVRDAAGTVQEVFGGSQADIPAVSTAVAVGQVASPDSEQSETDQV